MTTKNDQVTTPEFRVSFPAVFAATSMDPSQQAKFKITMLFDKKSTDFTAMKTMVKEVAVAKWGAAKAKWPKNVKFPFRDGSEKDTDGYGENVTFCTASSKIKPGLVDHNLNPILDQSEFYGGCYARATVNAYAWKFMGKEGISLGLRNIQKTRDGEPFSGKARPENDFDAVALPVDNSTEDSGSSDLDDLGI